MAKSGFATGFAGFLIGVVTGLGIAAGAALLINMSPVPLVDKVDKVTADVDPSAALAGGVDPNARLNKGAADAPAPDAAPAREAPGGVAAVRIGDNEPRRDASGKAREPGEVKPVTFWVQTGSYSSEDDANDEAAQLALAGHGAQISQAGSHWRVRVGPFDDRRSAEETLAALTDLGMKPVIAESR